MEYAPIIIGTLCRYEHFKRAIESLQNNQWAQYTNIYIGVDYPSKDTHWEGYNKIVDYLKTNKLGFKSTNIFIREKNYGARKNFEELRKLAFKENGMMIATEDDNIFAPNFIEYIDTLLELYKNNSNIIGICGYSYPIDWNDNDSDYVLNRNFFSAWGWATWKEKWEELNNNINEGYFNDIVADTSRLKKLRHQAPKSYYYLMRMVGKKEINVTDVTISIYMVDRNKHCVMPKKSMVRNCGWDGSGINCNGKLEYDPQEQEIDDNLRITKPNISKIICVNDNMKKLNNLFAIKSIQKMESYFIELIIKVIGINNYCKLRSFIKKRF